MQAKLLRVLEEGEVERIGADKPTTVDVRVVVARTATSNNWSSSGGFRRDLTIASLCSPWSCLLCAGRARICPLLSSTLLARSARRTVGSQWASPDAAIDALKQYAWPGNIRDCATWSSVSCCWLGACRCRGRANARAFHSTPLQKQFPQTASPLAAVGPLAERVLTFEREEC